MPKLAELIQIVMLTAITCPRLRNFDDVTDHVTDFRLLSAYLNGLSELLHQLTQEFSFRASTPSGSSSSKIIVVVSSRQ